MHTYGELGSIVYRDLIWKGCTHWEFSSFRARAFKDENFPSQSEREDMSCTNCKV